MSSTAVGRGVWAMFETGRMQTLDDFHYFAELDPAETLYYLNTLIQERYVTVRLSGRANSGESVCLFLLTRFTGPKAPYLDDKGRFVDPNLQKKGKPDGQGCRGGLFVTKGQPPTPSARIVAAARRIGATFNREQILAAAGLTGLNEHTSAYIRGLTARGWLFRLGPNEWKYAGTPPEAQVVERLLARAAGKGQLDMAAAHKKWGKEIPQRTIGFVVDLMRAEGWRISQGRGKGQKGRTQYLVEKKLI